MKKFWDTLYFVGFTIWLIILIFSTYKILVIITSSKEYIEGIFYIFLLFYCEERLSTLVKRFDKSVA